VKDPSGHTVQVMPSASPLPLLEHVVIEEHDLEHAEVFYAVALGGRLQFDHGWDVANYRGLEAWMSGDDPAAPFTRRVSLSYRTRQPEALPMPQVFFPFGSTRLGLFLANVHRQEPPYEQISGTPSIAFDTRGSADAIADYLENTRVTPVNLKYDGGAILFEREGDVFSIRDPGGHFIQLQVRSSSQLPVAGQG
jgi:hypothetical protein